MSTSLPSHILPSDLRAALNARLKSITPGASDSKLAFMDSATRWVKDWRAKNSGKSFDGFAPYAILYSEGLPPTGDSRWITFPLFREEYSFGLGGAIAATTTSMFDVRTLLTDAKTLSELGREIESLGLESNAALLVDPQNAIMVCCPNGLRDGRITLSLTIEPLTDLSQMALDNALIDFHREYMQYPEGYCEVWHDRPKRILLRPAETIARDNLLLYLRHVAFRSQSVIREEHLPVGRTDISIIDNDGTAIRTRCVLELKVLRSRGLSKGKDSNKEKPYSDQVMINHSKRGVRQAIKYKASTKAEWAYTCFYDGRDGDVAMKDIEDFAAQNGILYRRYYMETSTRDDLDDKPSRKNAKSA